jgi:hypothetical protein
MIRQGDIILIPTSSVEIDKLQPAPKDPRGIVLAEGETSGHFHALVGRGKLFRFRDTRRDQMLLRVTSKSGGKIAVVGGEINGSPRHKTLLLEKGDYIVRVQRSWTSANASRKVSD